MSSIKIDNYTFSYDHNLKNILINEIKYSSQNNNISILNKSKQKFSLLEKYIYDLTQFYHKKNNLNFENNYIEFWCKTKIENTNLHVDCDENLRKNNIYEYPSKSLVTYFNNNNNPTILTNIDYNQFIYKNFEKDNELLFSLPVENKVLIFDGSKYHGVNYGNNNSINEERTIIAINIWDKKPTVIHYYENNDKNNNEKYDKNEDIFTFLCNTNIDEKISTTNINYDLMNDILYNGRNIFPLFKENIENNNKSSNFLFKNKKKDNVDILLKNKYGKLMDDIHFIYNKKGQLNRFYQRFKIEKILTYEMGKWIINEAEKYASNYGWTTQRHDNYPTTDLPVKELKNVYTFFNILFQEKITKILRECYNLNDVEFTFNDIFIVKYNEKQQNFLEMHSDGSFLSFNILLNNENEFKGGGTMFEDGLVMNSKQGDLIIHSSLVKHSGLQVYKGTRYIMVGFINLKLIP